MTHKKEVSSERPSKPQKPVSRKATTATEKPEAMSGNIKETTNTITTIKPEERYKMIAQAAYFRAEARGFNGGNPDGDWIQAEIEVDQHLRQLQ